MNMDAKCCGETGRAGSIEYPRWHAGQLVTDQDLNDQLQYLLGVNRLLNRMLHGWGVVCGLLVCMVRNPDNGTQPWTVQIMPGLALSPWGDHIVVDCPTTVDLRKSRQDGPTDEPIDPKSDPWCSDVYERKQGGTFYVCVHYWRAMTRPVRVQPLGCGCDDTQCEYSRWRDSFKVCLLDDCPTTHLDPPSQVEGMFRGGNPECPECPEQDCVVLAKVVVDDEGTIVEIDNCSCRRLVVSFARLWWRCEGGKKPGVRIDPVRVKNEIPPGEGIVTVTGNFEKMPAGATVTLVTEDGTVDVDVAATHIQADSLHLTVKVPETAKLGPRTLSIVDSEGNEIARRKSVITIVSARAERVPGKDASPKAAKGRKPPSRRASRRTTRPGAKPEE